MSTASDLISVAPTAIQAALTIAGLIASLVHPAAKAAEAQIGSGGGPVKLSQVFEAVIGWLQKAAAVGTIPKELPSDDTIKMIIQAVVSSMKISGLLGDAPTTVPTNAPVGSPDGIILKAGQSVTITVAG